MVLGGWGVGWYCSDLLLHMQIHDTGEAETNGDMYGEGGEGSEEG